MFAKLFETSTEGQVLVRLITGSDDRPSVTFSFEHLPTEELSTIVDVALGFKDWETAQACFDKQDEYTVTQTVRAVRKDLCS